MTITNQTDKVEGIGNASATEFSFSPMVLIDDSTQIQVTHVDANDVETLLSEGTGPSAYSVSVASFPGTGSVTYPEDAVTPMPVGEKIVMKRVLTLEQQIDLENQGGYFPEVQEKVYDRLTAIDIQQQEEIDRSIKVPVGDDSGADFTLPLPVPTELFRWDGTGLALEGITAAGLGLVVASLIAPTAVTFGSAAVGTADDYAREDHQHNIVGPIAVADGGTGQTTAGAFRVPMEVDRPVQTKTGNYTQVASDINNMIRWTTAGTYNLLAVATAGNDFSVDIMADGVAVTIDPSGAEPVNGAATLVVPTDTSGSLFCDGAAWYFLAGGGGGGSYKGENGTVAASNLGDIFRVHEQELNTSTTIAATENAVAAGPLTVASGITLTVTSGGNLVIV
jgi:hypothetical protein